jgi:NH3-dependent NAD+ synthetase
MPVQKSAALVDQRVEAIRRYHEGCGLRRAELDLSGGIDSAVLAGLLVLALGPEQITLVYSSINSGSQTQDRASSLAKALGVSLIVHDLTPTYEAMVEAMMANLTQAGWDGPALQERVAKDPTILGSIRSCLRAPLGRGYSRLTGNGIRHGTGNECEDRWLRFYQKGGDGEVDTNPIAMLSKGEVFQLAAALGQRLGGSEAYGTIIAAPPTPELWGQARSHTDEDEIGSYLGITDSDQTFYSYIDPTTGAYGQVGMIERVARFADTPPAEGLFEDSTPPDRLQKIISAGPRSAALGPLPPQLVERLLRAARRTERISRHKYNPACPTLGTRAELLSAGILTDTLPSC